MAGLLFQGGQELPAGLLAAPASLGAHTAVPPGTALTDPTALVNAGVRVGTGYGVVPSSQDWVISAGAAGTYHYQCTIHDWIQGTITIRSESDD